MGWACLLGLAWPAGWPAGWLAGFLSGLAWLAGWLVGQLAGWVAGWLSTASDPVSRDGALFGGAPPMDPIFDPPPPNLDPFVLVTFWSFSNSKNWVRKLGLDSFLELVRKLGPGGLTVGTKLRPCFAQTNPVRCQLPRSVILRSVFLLGPALQYAGAQRLTGGRGGASRRLRAGQRFALPSVFAARRAAFLKILSPARGDGRSYNKETPAL